MRIRTKIKQINELNSTHIHCCTVLADRFANELVCDLHSQSPCFLYAYRGAQKWLPFILESIVNQCYSICLKWLKEDLKLSLALLKCKLNAYYNMMSYWSHIYVEHDAGMECNVIRWVASYSIEYHYVCIMCKRGVFVEIEFLHIIQNFPKYRLISKCSSN